MIVEVDALVYLGLLIATAIGAIAFIWSEVKRNSPDAIRQELDAHLDALVERLKPQPHKKDNE